MLLDQFLEVFIGANLLVLSTAIAFVCIEGCLSIVGFRKSYSTRLWLLTGSMVTASLIPALTYFGSIAQFRAAPHISDILVAQYLKGNISISAVAFDNFLSTRASVFQAVHSGSNSWILATLGLIFAGIAGRLIYILFNMIRIRIVLGNGHKIRKSGSVEIIVSGEIDVPFSTRGLTKHYVVMPENLLGESATFSIALGHEFQHIRQKDVTIECLLALCSPFFVFNPGYWIMSSKLRKLREHTCDIEYLHRSRVNARDYANALLSVAKKATMSRRLSRVGSLSVPFIGRGLLFSRSTKSQLANRVHAFADESIRKPHKLFTASLLATASAFILLGTSAFQPTSGWSHDRIMISSVANLERLNLRNQAKQSAATTTD